MIKVDVVINEKENIRHLYFESANRDSGEIERLDWIYQAISEGNSGIKGNVVEYINSNCFRYSVKMPKRKTEPMPESPPVPTRKIVRKGSTVVTK